MPPTLGDRLSHILTAIEDIRALLRGRSRADFASDIMLRMAVERLLEIISEASRFIPAEIRADERTIPWQAKDSRSRELAAARYHRIDADILWNIAENDLELLKQFVERIVKTNGQR